MVKVVGLWSGHDASCAIFEDGKIILHTELERHTRLKEDQGDIFKFWRDKDPNWNDNDPILTSCWKTDNTTKHPMMGKQFHYYGHHLSHAAHAYYSSKFNDAMIFTFDAGGFESEDLSSLTTCTISLANNLDLKMVKAFPFESINIGGIWTRVTKYVFGYESGWPQGHQAGTVMALAALGDPQKYKQLFMNLLTVDMPRTLYTPQGHMKGMSAKDPLRPKHPFLGPLEDLANSNDQERYDLAAGFQAATEDCVFQIMELAFKNLGIEKAKNVCLVGGVSLNSSLVGKVKKQFPFIENIYVPPCPYDAGLSLGSAQYHMHHVMRIERPDYGYCFPPYLGEKYSQSRVWGAVVASSAGNYHIRQSGDIEAISALGAAKIVSVFNGRAESGRRALGNRSILADPRNPKSKDIVNEKVKHRQWFRPFAPSILKEDVTEWFEKDVDSPYMSFVANFKENKKHLVPAVVHFDGTGRLQTVTESSNPWYYGFLKQWKEYSGVPIILNSSLNDREPVCESPEDAIKCFLKTQIDCLYFAEYGIMLEKK